MRAYSVFLVILQITACLSSKKWSYKRQDEWSGSCTTGKWQSPIPIRHSDTITKNFEPIVFDENFYQEHEAAITNTGYTIDVHYTNSSNAPKISNGNLPRSEYTFSNLHFHWGAEHTIDGRRYPLEAHFVFYASDYDTLENALNYKDGIVVIGILYKITNEPNYELNIIIKQVPAIAHRRNKGVILQQRIKLINFLPNEGSAYYRYEGSLTIPECNEVVTWIVFQKPLELTGRQWSRLTNIYKTGEQRIHSNYRELQQIYCRDIYYVQQNSSMSK